MMEINSEGAQSYTIPLDSVDWTYLSKYVRTPHAETERRPLWTRKCLDGESEYCHVQIVTQDDNEDCYSEETFDTFHCHICNIEVPVLCFKKHNESEKHVTLKTIFQKVFERVSKQINICVMNSDKDIDKDVYYCEPCSKIIKKENKCMHKSSQHHVKSQRDINFVHQFHKIFEENKGYIGVKKVNNEEILDEKRFGTEFIQNDTKNSNVKGVTNEDKSNNNEIKTVCSTNDHTMKTTSKTVEHLVLNEEHNEELTSEENYLKDMDKKYNLKVNLPIVDGEFVHVASPSGVRAKILRNHFHSYHFEGVCIHCKMCRTRLNLVEEYNHTFSEEHVRKIFLPVNEQFARTINDFKSHCLICNKVVLTSTLFNHHLYDNKHVKLLNGAKTDICQNNEVFANGINTETIESTHSIDNHVNTSEENMINKCINNKKYSSKVNLFENDICDHHNESGHLARTEDATFVQKLVFCKLCNVSVPQDQMEYHNAGTPHWSNAFKNICTGVVDGLQAKFSKDNLKTYSDSSEKQNETPKNDYVASTSVSNITNNEIDSSSPFRYADSMENKVTCIVCDVDIANVLQSMTKHEESSNHNLALQHILKNHTIRKHPKRSFCECCCDINVTNIWAHISTERHTALLQLEFELNSELLKLNVYKRSIRNPQRILSRELYKMLLESNKIYKLPNSHFYCTFCELEMSEKGNEIDHMFSAAHEKWLKMIYKSRPL